MSRSYLLAILAARVLNKSKMIPALERVFPNYTLVVRPNQVESQDVYLKIAARCERVRVTNKGYVVPWLMASIVLIHHGLHGSSRY